MSWLLVGLLLLLLLLSICLVLFFHRERGSGGEGDEANSLFSFRRFLKKQKTNYLSQAARLPASPTSRTPWASSTRTPRPFTWTWAAG